MSVNGDEFLNAEVASVESYDTYNYEMVDQRTMERRMSQLSDALEAAENTGQEEKKEEEAVQQQESWLTLYFRKFLGVKDKVPPPMQKIHEMVISSILAFIGILLVSLSDYYYLTENFDANDIPVKMLSGACGATSGNEISFLGLKN
jgi:hypothetical protein